jgi:hypothetical protein
MHSLDSDEPRATAPRPWWKRPWAVTLAVVLGLLLATAGTLTLFVLDDSDLDRVDARARSAGMPLTREEFGFKPDVGKVAAMKALARRIESLPKWNNAVKAAYCTRVLSDQSKPVLEARAVIATWPGTEISLINAEVQTLSERSFDGETFYFIDPERGVILTHLALNLIAADSAHVPEALVRLTKFMLITPAHNYWRFQNIVAYAIGLGLTNLPQGDAESAGNLTLLSQRFQQHVRLINAAEFVWYRENLRAGRDLFATLGVAVPKYEQFGIRAIESRIFRAWLLKSFIDDFELLAQPNALTTIAGAIPLPTAIRSPSWWTADTIIQHSSYFRRAEIIQLLFLRILAAELGGTPLPEDPFAPGHQVQAKVVAGWNVRYSIGPDRVDNGGGNGDVVMRLYPVPASASAPAIH